MTIMVSGERDYSSDNMTLDVKLYQAQVKVVFGLQVLGSLTISQPPVSSLSFIVYVISWNIPDNVACYCKVDAESSSYFDQTVLYYNVSYNVMYYMPCHAMPCHAMPCHAIPYHTIPYHTIPYHTIPYHTIPYHTIPYDAIPRPSNCINLCLIAVGIQTLTYIDGTIHRRTKPYRLEDSLSFSSRSVHTLVLSLRSLQKVSHR